MKALLLTSAPVLDAAQTTKLLENDSNSITSTSYVTQSHSLGSDALPRDTYDLAVAIGVLAGPQTASLLTQLLSTLVPGGRLTLLEGEANGDSELQRALLLAGFADGKTTASPEFPLKMEAFKPTWKAGSTSAISLRATPAGATKAPAKEAQGQKLSWSLLPDDDGELIDEDELLTEEDLQRPAPLPEDCGTGRVKGACKNCTCGRAEGKVQKVELTPELLANPQSGCGSDLVRRSQFKLSSTAKCALGDAFRCGGCPYRGLPAFEKGKKIELPSDFLTADA